jgi:chromosome segregation ATPase
MENLKTQFIHEINSQKEKLLEDSRVRLEGKENEKLANANELNKKIDELTAKLDKVKSDKIELEDIKNTLVLREKDLNEKYSSGNLQLSRLLEENENFRSRISNYERTISSQDKVIAESTVKIELLNKQIDEKEKNIQNLTTIVQNLSVQKSEQDDNIRSLKNTNNKLDSKLKESIDEINKGNEIINKLTVRRR